MTQETKKEGQDALRQHRKIIGQNPRPINPKPRLLHPNLAFLELPKPAELARNAGKTQLVLFVPMSLKDFLQMALVLQHAQAHHKWPEWPAWAFSLYLAMSLKRAPQNRFQNDVILVMGTPQKGISNVGKPVPYKAPV